MNKLLCPLVFLLVLIFVCFKVNAQTIRYVKEGGAGSKDGSSWTNASDDFQATVFASASNDQVWVSAGTYQPRGAFSMKEGVKIFGGFTGDETSLQQRSYITSISKLQGNGSSVIINYNNGVTQAAVLDGFTITGGTASSGGGGIDNRVASPTITNCIFVNNTSRSGGAIYNSNSNPVISNCVFSNNSITSDGNSFGGAINNYGSSPLIINSNFFNNTATGSVSSSGGAIFSIFDSNPTIVGCTFKGNTAGSGGALCNSTRALATVIDCVFSGNSADAGGGIYNFTSYPSIITNCVISGNSAPSGGGVYNVSASPIFTNVTIANNGASGFFSQSSGVPVLKNSIVWDVISGAYSAGYTLIKSKTDVSNGNVSAVGITESHIFNNYGNGDFTLNASSPAINRGNNALFTDLDASKLDLIGNDRVYNYANAGTIDLGAHEYQGMATASLTNFTDITKIDGDAAFALTAPNTNSTGAISYTSSNEQVATINGNIVTIVGGGTTIITAVQEATAYFNSNSISLALTVLPILSQPGNALDFDGIDDYVTMPPAANAVTGNFTVMQWVKPSHAIKAMHLFNTRENGNYSFDIQLMGGNKIHADIGNGTSWLTSAADVSYMYAVNEWIHIAYTVTPTGYTIYVNGKQLTTGSLSGIPLLLDANHKIVLGRNNSENTYFKGSMDEVKVFNVALSAIQVKQEMTGNGVDVAANLVAYFNFNTYAVTRSNQLLDESENEKHGTLTNFALTGATSNWVESYAMVIPTNTNAHTNGTDNAAIYWSKPQLGVIENYIVEVAKNNTFTEPIAGSPFMVAGSLTEQVITGLTPNTTYYYRLKANKASVAEQGAYTPVQFITIAKALAAGNALNFDGVDDYVSMTGNTANVSGSFTVMLWAKPDDVTKAMHLFSTREPASNAFDIQLVGGNRIHGDIGPGVGNWITTNADANYNYKLNQWLHIAYAVSPTGYKIYANGKEVGNGVLSDAPLLLDASNMITLGKNGTEDTYFKGNLDEVKVFNSTLSALEIKEEMLENTMALAANRILYYDFDLIAPSEMLYNYTGTDYKGVLNNFALGGTASNWVESYARVVPLTTVATAIGSDKFTANWTAPSIGAADNYILEVATDNTFATPIAGSPFTVTGLTKEITGLNAVTNYYYRVRADKTSVTGQGIFSEIITTTTGKNNQIITFNALDPKTTVSTDYVLTATASSGLLVSYTSSNTAVAEVYQDAGVWKVKIKGEGNTDITASQIGDSNYDAATNVVQQLIVTGGPLPVELISYTAKVEGSYAKLQWQTTQEVNNLQFTIYRSGDDKAFVKIGEVSATIDHQSLTINHYSYVDKQPLNGNNYYKLVQVDQDGKANEIGERALNFKLSTLDFQVYPNPTSHKITVTSAVGKFTLLTLSGIDGKILKTVQLKGLQHELELDLSVYPIGVYFIRLIGVHESVVKKVVKQ